MTYMTDLHTYLHQSSLLIQAYPTTRVTTKYSLPKKSDQTAKPSSDQPQTEGTSARIKREPAATLTLKTFHPESGICLKYSTDKAAEVGRLISGLGRLAKGEIIEMPSSGTATAGGDISSADRMQVGESSSKTLPTEEVSKTASQTTQTQQGGGGGKKKKKNKK